MLISRQAEIQKRIGSVGLDPALLDKQPLSRGSHHIVYKYDFSSEKPKVVKFPTRPPFGLEASSGRELRDMTLVREYFGHFFTESEVLASGSDYCLVSDYIDGRPLEAADAISRPLAGKVRGQLEEIVGINRELVDREGFCLDMMGIQGLIDFFAKTGISRLKQRLGNVLIPHNFSSGNLGIVDYDLIPLRGQNGPVSSIYTLAIPFERAVIRRFGIEM